MSVPELNLSDIEAIESLPAESQVSSFEIVQFNRKYNVDGRVNGLARVRVGVEECFQKGAGCSKAVHRYVATTSSQEEKNRGMGR